MIRVYLTLIAFFVVSQVSSSQSLNHAKFNTESLLGLEVILNDGFIESYLDTSPHYRSGDERTFISGNSIIIWDSGSTRQEILSLDAKSIKTASISKDGNVVAYTPIYGKKDIQEIFLKRLDNNKNRYFDYGSVYKLSLNPPIESIHNIRLSDNGNVLVWKEKVLGGHKIMIKNLLDFDSDPITIYEGRNISDEIILSGDGGNVFFFVFTENNGNRVNTTYYSFNTQGKWSDARPLLIDGNINNYIINASNYDASIVWLGPVLMTKGPGSTYTVDRLLEIPEGMYFYAPQMSDDSNTIAFIAVSELPGYTDKISEEQKKVTKELHLVKYREKNTPKAFILDKTNEELSYKMKTNGEEIKWRKK